MDEHTCSVSCCEVCQDSDFRGFSEEPPTLDCPPKVSGISLSLYAKLLSLSINDLDTLPPSIKEFIFIDRLLLLTTGVLPILVTSEGETLDEETTKNIENIRTMAMTLRHNLVAKLQVSDQENP